MPQVCTSHHRQAARRPLLEVSQHRTHRPDLITKITLRSLARRIKDLADEIAELNALIDELTGVGPQSVAPTNREGIVAGGNMAGSRMLLPTSGQTRLSVSAYLTATSLPALSVHLC